jgi:hypothetical protein
LLRVLIVTAYLAAPKMMARKITPEIKASRPRHVTHGREGMGR